LPLGVAPPGVAPAHVTCPKDGSHSDIVCPGCSAPVSPGLHDVGKERVGKEAHRLFVVRVLELAHTPVEGAVPAAEPDPPATAACPHVPHKGTLCLLPFLVVGKPSLQV
jgi:hypothetical protein